MRKLRAAIAVLAILASAASLPAQDGSTLRVGMLFPDGLILLVGAHDERGWRHYWGGYDYRQKIKCGSEMAQIPPAWWGTEGKPSGSWRALFADGTETLLEVRGANFGCLGGNEHWMPKTNLVPRPPEEDEYEFGLLTNPPVLASRLAAVPLESAERAEVAERLAETFGRLERFEAQENLSAPDHARKPRVDLLLVLPVVRAAAEKSPPPIRIEQLLRSRCMVAGRHVYFVRATRRYPHPGGWRGDDTVSVLQGWLAAGEGEIPVWLRRNVEIGNGMIVREVQPIGVFEHDGKAFAIAHDVGHAESDYVVYELLPESMRRVLVVGVAGC